MVGGGPSTSCWDRGSNLALVIVYKVIQEAIHPRPMMLLHIYPIVGSRTEVALH